MPTVEADRLGAQHPFHACHPIGLRRVQLKMEMIGHQDPRNDLPSTTLAGFPKNLSKHPPVFVILEDRFPPVASAHHVLVGPGVFNARLTWHLPTVPSRASPSIHRIED